MNTTTSPLLSGLVTVLTANSTHHTLTTTGGHTHLHVYPSQTETTPLVVIGPFPSDSSTTPGELRITTHDGASSMVTSENPSVVAQQMVDFIQTR